MNRQRYLRSVLVTCLIVALGSLTLRLWQEYKHERLNHELIQAIKIRNDQNALELLSEGADGNARDMGAPLSLSLIVQRFLGSFQQQGASYYKQPEEATHMGALHLLYAKAYEKSVRHPDPGPNIALVRSLLEHGAFVNERSVVGSSPLYYASCFNNSEAVRLLLERGANTEVPDRNGNTPLIGAEAEATKVLLEYGAHIDARNKKGWTALRYAVSPPPHLDTIRILLEHGANVELKGTDGKTALDIVSHNTDVTSCTIATLLRKYGAK